MTMRLLLLAGALAGMATLASATNINCAGGPGAPNTVTVPDVTMNGMGVGGGNSCSVVGSNMVFSNFAVSATGAVAGASVGIGSYNAGTQVIGAETYLAFQIAGAGPGNGDIQLTYEITGAPVFGLDMAFTATPLSNGGSITITEKACSVAFTAGNCVGGTQWANFAVTSSGQFASASALLSQGPQSTVFILKDISFSNATTSELTNSQLGTVPEPLTLSMVGLGLLGLGLAGRKLRR